LYADFGWLHESYSRSPTAVAFLRGEKLGGSSATSALPSRNTSVQLPAQEAPAQMEEHNDQTNENYENNIEV